MQTIDITNTMRGILSALNTFVTWMRNTYISNSGARVSVFDIVLTALAVYVILDSFIPWGGDED